jgi:hypothetical protein
MKTKKEMMEIVRHKKLKRIIESYEFFCYKEDFTVSDDTEILYWEEKVFEIPVS